MSGFTLVTLRRYHGGVLDLSSGQLVYSGGQVTEFLDVDMDRLSYFELKGYIKELGYTTTCTFSINPPNSGILEDIHNDMDILDLSCSLEDGDTVEVYVKHLIDDAVVDPTLILLENVPHGDMEESGSTFNKVNEQSEVGEDHFTTFDTRSGSTPTPPTTTYAPRSPSTTTTYSTTTFPTTTAAPRSPSTKTPPTTTAAPRSPSTTTHVTAANPSIEDDDDLVSGPVESDFLEEEGSDYSTEDSVEYKCRLVGDDDEDYGSDVHEEVRELRAEKRSFQRRKRKKRVPADTEEVPVSETRADLGFDETQTDKISVEERLGGDEPYFASSDDGSFEIDEDEFSDECVEFERVNLPRTVKRRRRPNNQKIIHDPTAKKVLWQLGMVFADVNEFKRAVSKYVLQKRVQIEKCVNEPKRVRCDHIVEFGKILDYKDKLLRTNPGSTCAVKLGEPDALARHKTIITMLDEIRVKMMTRIAKLREFTNTWMCDFSPMYLKVLQENIDRSMNCNIEFNEVDGFEVKEGPFQHSVDLGRWTCSCRVWQLKGIPCAHDVAAIYFKKYEPLDYIDNCYSKATYLRTYANVLQPVTNMEMWHVSTNPTVAPPEIKSMPGRPGKLRKKEAGESKKSGKLPRTGLVMTCSNCNVRGHNKRGCPQRVESSTREEPSNTDKGNGKTSCLGRPKKAQIEGEHSTKRSRGRPPAAPSASLGPAKRSRGRPPAAPSASPGPAKRGRPLIAPAAPNVSATPAKSARERPPAAASAPPTCPSPANYHVGSSTPADYQLTNSNKGRGRGREAQPHTKGKQSLEWPGMSSCKIFSNGTTKVTKSADVTGDIGYKPSTAPNSTLFNTLASEESVYQKVSFEDFPIFSWSVRTREQIDERDRCCTGEHESHVRVNGWPVDSDEELDDQHCYGCACDDEVDHVFDVLPKFEL
ncbi:hypothetical protein H5410_005050 [Solanum commersonii]|uniref:SWIM-type domain-containing protein n=1 Tax=Solanum commersonii TaxID=4109 RepID=A0A9J6A631_SOLCO|nr:hypothetical protein H5410_005050 [Solanum commersonii]